MASLGALCMNGQITTKMEEQELLEWSLMVFINNHSDSAGNIYCCYTVD